MDNNYSTTNFAERKKGQHLKLDDRGAIQALKKQGYSNRALRNYFQKKSSPAQKHCTI